MLLFLISIPSTGFWWRLLFSLKFPGKVGAEEKGDASLLLYQHALSSLPPIWFMDPPREEDESRPPPASSWQPAKAGRAWWDAPLGLRRCLSFLLHLPHSDPLEWDEGSCVEKLNLFLWFSLPLQLHLRGRHRLVA